MYSSSYSSNNHLLIYLFINQHSFIYMFTHLLNKKLLIYYQFFTHLIIIHLANIYSCMYSFTQRFFTHLIFHSPSNHLFMYVLTHPTILYSSNHSYPPNTLLFYSLIYPTKTETFLFSIHFITQSRNNHLLI